MPSVYTEMPSFYTEMPSVYTEMPSFYTEMPSVYTEMPSFYTEMPSVCTEKFTHIYIWNHLHTRIYSAEAFMGVYVRAASLYVCASVYRCICMEVYMYVRVFIGVYAWKFICMCECL